MGLYVVIVYYEPLKCRHSGEELRFPYRSSSSNILGSQYKYKLVRLLVQCKIYERLDFTRKLGVIF